MELNKRSSTCGAEGRLESSSLGFALIRTLGASAGELICLRSGRVYTVGRSRRHCDLVLLHRRVSKRHCQIFLDGFDRKLRLVDGFLLPPHSHIHQIRQGLRSVAMCSNTGVSLNGVFVNGRRIRQGKTTELAIGDEVLVSCRSGLSHGCRVKCGFAVEKIVYSEAKVVSQDIQLSGLQRQDVDTRSLFLLNQLTSVLASADPVFYLNNFTYLHQEKQHEALPSALQRAPLGSLDSEKCCKRDDGHVNVAPKAIGSNENALQIDKSRITSSSAVGIIESTDSQPHIADDFKVSYSDGRTFFLNRLKSMGSSTSDCSGVTLSELLHPMKTLVRVFIATFTCDVSWFLSCCQVPNHLPVTIASHNTERCWSASSHSRGLKPYVNYPNLLLVYPPFPEEIAFGKDRNKQGVACHHPKLFVLQRNESLRVVVTSANLVSRQWDNITNTVWWQDFPRRTTPDYSDLFRGIEELKTDFAAQLAGFVASLLVDVPSQAHWINVLAMYDFGQAACHLVASLPGIHFPSPYLVADHSSTAKQILQCKPSGNFLGSVQTTVVGLSHRFHSTVDPHGGQLKLLASLLRHCQENSSGIIEVFLKRITNLSVDANAVSVVVATHLNGLSEGDSMQLGFLPKDVAKWLSPLSDIGFFCFSAFICPKQVLAAAVGDSNTKVQLFLSVSQGPKFSEMPRLMNPEHHIPLCLLVASLKRCLGLWRLKEVLSKYKWPESLEVDFVYGSSSIGTSVNFQFFSAFSAAAGKKSCVFPDSEESDPEWGCWTVANELKRPSIRVLFPTIERVKNGHRGIQDSRCLLSLSEPLLLLRTQKTWQRLKTTGIFHDAIPCPSERLRFPMHIKVAQRRFQSASGLPSFGWIYVGSHNFSPAAWGHTLLTSSESKTAGAYTTSSKLHICNYELGIVLIAPPPDLSKREVNKSTTLDDFVLPFVMPAPRYKDGDRPATRQAMREALAEVTLLQESVLNDAMEGMNEDVLEEEENLEEPDFSIGESEQEKIYAEMLWGQMDSSES